MPTPEELARQTIDALLRAAGWVVQSLDELNLSAARGVAVREMQSFGGPSDYSLFVDIKTPLQTIAKNFCLWRAFLAMARKNHFPQ